jgi:hypothetical protein
MLIADLEEEVGRIDEWCYSGRRNSLEACCCVDEGLLPAYLDSVAELPSVTAICREGLNCSVSSAILPLNLLYPCLCDLPALSNSYMIKAGDVTLSSGHV